MTDKRGSSVAECVYVIHPDKIAEIVEILNNQAPVAKGLLHNSRYLAHSKIQYSPWHDSFATFKTVEKKPKFVDIGLEIYSDDAADFVLV